MVKCDNCGITIPEGMESCPNCGKLAIIKTGEDQEFKSDKNQRLNLMKVKSLKLKKNRIHQNKPLPGPVKTVVPEYIQTI